MHTSPLPGRCMGMVSKWPKQRISNSTQPDKIYLTGVCVALVTAPQTSVGPLCGWPNQIRELLRRKTETWIPKPSLSTRKENSVCRHAHLSPVETSQSPVDNHIRKPKGGFQCQCYCIAVGPGTMPEVVGTIFFPYIPFRYMPWKWKMSHSIYIIRQLAGGISSINKVEKYSNSVPKLTLNTKY